MVAVDALPSLSRAYVHHLIHNGRIQLNGQSFKPGHKLKLGDTLTIDFDQSEIERIPDIDLPVIYQDDNVIVINKPTGVISHARGKYWNEPSVASFIRQKTGQPGERAGIVHRLDRATSGVMVCAKNSQALGYLQKQFSLRKVEKNYLAIVSGHLKPTEALIDVPIERNPNLPQLFRAGSNGKPAQTVYKVIDSFSEYDKVSFTPKTGRTHQLRVHMRYLKHPIVGDQLYGGQTAGRLFLHAQSLRITLPGGEQKLFAAKEPDEFKRFQNEHS